ncbi:N-acetylmuramoyl-L-alanine amidase [Mycolicibacterium fallax]|uniref:N-acetylmuramoyl-L-alanine amidase n=1 Tax=Mycolicibacterium fallax TaxID=1793 RepID=UPI001F1FE07A|nr:N-acetylmuramoyl-L-alanine amidase [Mycolicibacterium fallax]
MVTAEAPPQPVTVAPKAGTQAEMLCRSAWGAMPPHPGGQPHTITRMTLHHTAAVLGDNSNAPGRLRQHQRFHQGERGWIDIAYHVGIDRNGNIYELRDWHLSGDTATNYNPAGHFLVLCEGDFDQEQTSEAQLHSAALAFAWASQKFQVPAQTLAGHRDFAATACPGENLYARLADGEIKRRVDEILSAGPVDLRTVCGPEAALTVQRIEAGG